MLTASVEERADAIDRRGRRRSPATLKGHWQGRAPITKGKRLPAEPLSASEVYALMDANTGRRAELRNRALLMLLWRSGLRCAEVLALKPKDVDLNRGVVTVLHGKGDKRRAVAIDEATCATLERWLAQRAELGLDERQYVFCVMAGASAGEALHSGQVRTLLRTLGRDAAIVKRVHAHGLRHTYAAYLLQAGVPLPYIRAMLGHASLRVTERYCDHLAPIDALNRVRAVSWPADRKPSPRTPSATRPRSAASDARENRRAATATAPARTVPRPTRMGSRSSTVAGARVAWR